MDSNLKPNEEIKATDLVKRYLPIHMVGMFVCIDCIIECSKNMIGIDYPEILQIETHSEEEFDEGKSNEKEEIALKCLTLILSKKKSELIILPSTDLMFNNIEDTIFIGSKFSSIKNNETPDNFKTRVKGEIESLELLKESHEKYLDELRNSGNFEDLNEEYPKTIMELNDISIYFEQRNNLNDKDDLDIGLENGFSSGTDFGIFLSNVALYKMFKKKILTDKFEELNTILDGTIMGFRGNPEELSNWQEKFNKHIKKIEENEKEEDKNEGK